MAPISRSTSVVSTRPAFARSMPPRSFRCRARPRPPPDFLSFRLTPPKRESIPLALLSFARLSLCALFHAVRIELQRTRLRREFAAFAVARVFEIDPVVRVDVVAGDVIARLQHAHENRPGGKLR